MDLEAEEPKSEKTPIEEPIKIEEEVPENPVENEEKSIHEVEAEGGSKLIDEEVEAEP